MSVSGAGSAPHVLIVERERELVAGFLTRRPAAETAFVVYMQGLLRREILSNFSRQLDHLSDLEQSALVKLCEIRDDQELVKRICPPLAELAKYLVDAPARKQARVKRLVRLKPKHDDRLATAPNQQAATALREVEEIAASLPRGMANTMLAHEAFLKGSGPPLAEALGVSPDNARRRLARALAAVVRIADGQDVELQQEPEEPAKEENHE